MFISKRSCMDHTVLSAKTPCLPLRQKVYPDSNFVLFFVEPWAEIGFEAVCQRPYGK